MKVRKWRRIKERERSENMRGKVEVGFMTERLRANDMSRISKLLLLESAATNGEGGFVPNSRQNRKESEDGEKVRGEGKWGWQ